MQHQLVLRFRKASLDSPDQVQALERALAESLGDTAQVDGIDTSAREIDLFIASADPASTFRRGCKPALQAMGLLDKATVAWRVEGGARFTVIWPLKYGRKFSLK